MLSSSRLRIKTFGSQQVRTQICTSTPLKSEIIATISRLYRCKAGPEGGLKETEQASSTDEETRKLSDLRRQQQQKQVQPNVAGPGGLIQGAVEQAQLITWPKPEKAFLDTFLVLGIVIGTGAMLLAVNVLLASGSEWWYHRG
ncbi:hypothetical protein CEUSTIGMA_g11061.t1 [Chlamydomonas eustigma]|uniref:Uncharacterized protein n=1 Tax=Chlamydomonas eustigma TaxID=1157962 RepID=A0A250XKQ3_9CHLO|nr:hypothetical protein CEUSTIGMA_g11061.t1 [Chlamydomonas eustigma]|eukprot:GAX83637.1 hypothetical protein CEUSTIGMA_g11061.t1 [Chlamydomonas eustigma]